MHEPVGPCIWIGAPTMIDSSLRSSPYGRTSCVQIASQFVEHGAPERIRTSDPQIRNLVLYPTEYRGGGGILADISCAAIHVYM